MEPNERLVTLAELRRNTGERGSRIYVACQGLVYDLTDCFRWKSGLHEGLHFAGQDLTAELGEARHKDDVFKHPGVKFVGRLST